MKRVLYFLHYICTNVLSHQQLCSPYSHQHLFPFLFVVIVTVIIIKWVLTVVWSCISLVTKDTENFIWLSAIHMSSFEKYLFVCFPFYQIIFIIMRPLNTLDTNFQVYNLKLFFLLHWSFSFAMQSIFYLMYLSTN